MRKRKIAQHYKPINKMEFSKKWLIGCIIISIVYTTFSYVLAWFDKNAVETLTVEIIETLWGASSISFAGTKNYYIGTYNFYRFTLYNRALTTDELMNNYNIDIVQYS